jgi:hypothetical protein
LPQLDRLVEQIGSDQAKDLVPAHGDFHEAQVMVADRHPVGMVDIDTYGWGRAGDDAATLVGHLSVLKMAHTSPHLNAWASDLMRLCDRYLDPIDLRRRAAAVVLGLASGPFRVQRPDWPAMTRARIDLADRWCQSADRVAEGRLGENYLTSITGPAHAGHPG